MSNDKNAKKDSLEKTFEVAKNKFIANWKVILVAFIVAIVLLNTFWNMVDNRISRAVTTEIGALRTEIGTLRTDLANFDARLSTAEVKECAIVDTDSLKADIEAIEKAGEALGQKLRSFEQKLRAVIQAEEEKLTLLEKDTANQKTYVDALKKLLE